MWSIFCAIKRSWTQHFVTHFSGFVIMVLSLSAVFVVGLSIFNIQKIFNVWGQVNRVTAYIDSKSKPENIEKFEEYLRDHKIVQSFSQTSSNQSALQFKKNFSKISVQEMDEKKLAQFFPAFYEIKLNEEEAYKRGAEKLEIFIKATKMQFPVVSSLSYGKVWLQRYSRFLGVLNQFGYFMMGLLLFGSLVVCANVIKTLLYARREEIEILEFIGANEIDVYLPQIISLLITALLAFSVAFGLTYGAFYSLKTYNILGPSMSQMLEFFSPAQALLLLFLLLSGVGAYSMLTIFSLFPSRKKSEIIKEALH